nr:hypothetical protein [Clostridia bacterium]
MKNKKGFTLIELVVVVAILGILALLVVPNVVNRIKETRETVIDANIKVINNAIKMYYAEQGDYPDISRAQEGKEIEELLNKLQTAGYLDANEVTNALKAFENVSITVNTVQNTSKVTSIEKKRDYKLSLLLKVNGLI